MTKLPPFPSDWEPTRASLHGYSHVLGAVFRRHAPPHPKWWHLSLEVMPSGLTGDPMPLPDGRSVSLTLDITGNQVLVASSEGGREAIAIGGGRQPADVAAELGSHLETLGLPPDYDDSRYSAEVPGTVDSDAAGAFWTFLVAVDGFFRGRRAARPDPTSPVQLWPHGFDISFEWFGDKRIEHEEGGELTELPSQLNLGFYPGGEPYFYSNAWPFDESLLTEPLPPGASWHTEGWQGTILPLEEIAGAEDGLERLTEFAETVYGLSAPTL